MNDYDLFLDRELNMDVFTILNTGMITVSDLDTEQNTKVHKSSFKFHSC